MIQGLRDTALFDRLQIGMRCVGLGLFALCTTFRATAADEVEVTLVAEVREEVPAPGGRRIVRLVPARTLEQGQEIFYTVRIRNPASVAAKNVEVVQLVPENTHYVSGSATGPGVEVSVSADGGRTFGKEGQLTVVDQSAIALMEATTIDPAALTRPARPQDYTHIRWRLRNALAPGAVALARFRAVFR
ncbi:hypothetical protein [Povalibacter sp.]|uniref:hypothetical protein n=1 Tax=Povalibacter sp. TaxID=1962978 RepID=UPI002F4268F4